MTYLGLYHDREIDLSKDWSSLDLGLVVDNLVYKLDQLIDVTPHTYAAVMDLSRLEGTKLIAYLAFDQDSKEATLRVNAVDVTAEQLTRCGVEYTTEDGTFILGRWAITENSPE